MTKDQFTLWRKEQDEAKIRLHEDLTQEYGLIGHSLEEKLFELAWDFGHAYGDNEVRAFYDQMSVLLKKE